MQTLYNYTFNNKGFNDNVTINIKANSDKEAIAVLRYVVKFIEEWHLVKTIEINQSTL
jgi:hypothetical protein